MPSVRASTCSTFLAASSVVARLVPTGSVWVTVSVVSPDWSKKFVLSRPALPTVSAKSTTSATRR